MKKIFLATLLSIIFFPSFAMSEQDCPSLNLGPVATAHGVYVETQWGDFPWTTIKQDDGRKITIMCSEEEMEKHFGKVGQKVAVTSDMVQFFYSENSHCYDKIIVCTYKGAFHQSFPMQ